MKFEAKKSMLINIIKFASPLVDEAVFEFEDKNLLVEAVDPADVAFVSVDTDVEEFNEYSMGGEIFGTNLNKIEDILGLASSEDTKVTGLLEKETIDLTYIFENIEYTTSPIDPSTIREAEKPNLDLPISLKMDAKEFKQGIRASSMVSNAVNFIVKNEKLYIEAEGDDDSASYEMSPGEEIYDVSGLNNNMKAKFSLNYLEDISKNFSSDSEVQLNLGDEMPLEIYYQTPETEVMYVLAPRIVA